MPSWGASPYLAPPSSHRWATSHPYNVRCWHSRGPVVGHQWFTSHPDNMRWWHSRGPSVGHQPRREGEMMAKPWANSGPSVAHQQPKMRDDCTGVGHRWAISWATNHPDNMTWWQSSEPSVYHRWPIGHLANVRSTNQSINYITANVVQHSELRGVARP